MAGKKSAPYTEREMALFRRSIEERKAKKGKGKPKRPPLTGEALKYVSNSKKGGYKGKRKPQTMEEKKRWLGWRDTDSTPSPVTVMRIEDLDRQNNA